MALLLLLTLLPLIGGALAQEAPPEGARPPVANFNFSPVRPEPGQPVTASARPLTRVFEPCAPIVSYAWDWDADGVPETNGTSFISRHTYDELGVHPVTLRVTDSCGQSASLTKNLTVEVPRTGFDWSIIWENREAYARGALLTLRISSTAILAGLPLGILVALARLSPVPPVRWAAAAYVAFIRGTPLLVQIFIVVFALPQLGLRFSALTGGIIAMVINTSAYQAEIIRSGIQAIPSGQMEAALGLGMKPLQAMRFVVLPQALRLVIPPLTNEFVILIKDSSLLSVVGILELILTARILASQTFHIFEAFAGAAIVYFVLTYSLSLVLRRLEKKLAIPGLGMATGGGHQ